MPFQMVLVNLKEILLGIGNLNPPLNSSTPEKLNQPPEKDSVNGPPSKTPSKKGRKTKLILKANKDYELMKSQFAVPRRSQRVPTHKDQPTETPSQPPTNQETRLDNSFLWDENELVLIKPIRVYTRKIHRPKTPVEDDTVPKNDEKPNLEELTRLAKNYHNDCDKSKVGRRTLMFKLKSKPMKRNKDSAPAVVEAALFPNANRIKEVSGCKYHLRKPSKIKDKKPPKSKPSNSNRMMVFAKRKPRLLPSKNSATQCHFQL